MAFAEQAELTLLVPHKLVRDKPANALVGEYTLQEGIEILLAGTGLTPTFSNQFLLSISTDEQSAGEGDTVKTGKKAGLVAVLAGVLAGGVGAQEATTNEQETRTTVVTGKVIDGRTGANLKGAKVTVEETGQWTRTNGLGEYRFPSVSMGTVTLTVSYLGYPGQSAEVEVSGESVSRGFVLQGSSDVDEIVVYGSRSARALALNQERTAANSSSVISSDLLGTFNGTTISDALRRAPGVAFVPDPVTGDGTNVILRGLEPDLNQVLLNGTRVLDGTGLGRSPDLSNILTDNIDSVTISNTLLPSQDSNGAGGIVEIETKSPLDRDRHYASFAAEYGDRGGIFGDEYEIGGTLSANFGEAQDFGASISATYREREINQLNYSVGGAGDLLMGEYLPLDPSGNPATSLSALDPREPFPFIDGVEQIYPVNLVSQQNSLTNETLSVTGTLEKQFGEHTNLRLDASYFDRSDDRFTDNFNIISLAGYDLGPVAELGGDERYLAVTEDIFRSTGFGEVFGTGIPGAINRDSFFAPDASSSTLSFNLRGETDIDLWEFDYSVGRSESKSETASTYQAVFNTSFPSVTGFFDELAPRSFLTGQALSNTTDDGRIISIFEALAGSENQGLIFPLFTQEAFDYYNSIDNVSLDSITTAGPRDSEGAETTLEFSARRNLESGFVGYVEAGFEYRDTEFFAPADSGSSALGFGRFALASSDPRDLGLSFGDSPFREVGFGEAFSFVDREGFASIPGRIPQLVEDGVLELVTDVDASGVFDRGTSEETRTAYFQTQMNYGDLELIGGFRFEDIEIGSNSFQQIDVRVPFGNPDRDSIRDEARNAGEFVDLSVSQTSFMPRVLANYRFDENLVVRGAYGVTVSRPVLRNLTQQRFLEIDLNPRFGETGDQGRLRISEGNPDLKPAKTHSFDFSVEYYTQNLGVYKASVFYKRIEDPLRVSFTAGDGTLIPSDLELPAIQAVALLGDEFEVQLRKPFNDDDTDEIWGIVLTAEQQLSFLPSALDGLGVIGNYTYTDSSRNRQFNVSSSVDPDGVVEISDIPFDGSPEHQGTVGFTYQNLGFDGSLLYTYQSRRLDSFNEFFVHDYQESFGTLDLELAYILEIRRTKTRLFVRGRDLLRSDDETYLQNSIGGDNGVPVYYTGGTYLGGRFLSFGVSTTF